MTVHVNATDAARPVEAKASALKPRSGRAPQNKKQQLIRMLSTKAGADVASVSARLGGLPHTTRAALSGLKKAGHAIAVEKGGAGKPSRYRILTAPGTPGAQ